MRTKKQLRKDYRMLRHGLGPQQMHSMLAAMVDPLLEISLPRHPIILSYKAIEDKQEVPTEIFERILTDERSPKGFCYPAANFETGGMSAILDDEHLQWEDVQFGINQPKSGTLVPPKEIDIILVPLLAFDRIGNRLGYGKGFYDKFLKQCRPDAIKIGFSWFEAEVALPEIDRHDVPLNYCVIPHRLYVF